MFNLKFALSYFLHQFKAINRHGLHSPFVYRLVDEVIYDFSDKKVYTDLEKALPPSKKLTSADKLLYRLVADWQPHDIRIVGECVPGDRGILDHAISELISNSKTQQSNGNSQNTDTVIFIDATTANSSKNELEQLLDNFQEGVMLVIKNNHQSSRAHALWKQIKAHPRVTVSVDLFCLGLVYYRPGKIKEDFLIKF